LRAGAAFLPLGSRQRRHGARTSWQASAVPSGKNTRQTDPLGFLDGHLGGLIIGVSRISPDLTISFQFISDTNLHVTRTLIRVSVGLLEQAALL
jgi:hypothetical protein